MTTGQPFSPRELPRNESALRLSDIADMLKRRYKIILAFFLAYLLSAIYYDYSSVPYYQSEAVVLINQPGRALLSVSNASQFTDNNRRLLSTYAELSHSRVVIQRVIDKLQSAGTYEEIVPQITVSPLGDSDMLLLIARTKSPQRARDTLTVLIDVLAERLGEVVPRESLRERLQEAQNERVKAEGIFQQYARLRGEAEDDDTYRRLALEVNLADGVLDRLMREYQNARFYELIQPISIKIVDPPFLPEKPLEARWKYHRILIAGILGLFSGAFLALCFECMRKTGGQKA